jgi:hypothetical protein
MEKDMSEAQKKTVSQSNVEAQFCRNYHHQGRMYKMLEKIYHPHHPEFA